MPKQIMIVLGSPRKKGNSATLAEHVAKGAKAGGAKVETFYLNGMDIRPCQGCMKCQKPSARTCAIRDDMQALYPKMKEADAIVVASPVYWFSVSAQTKTFIDRWFAVGVEERNIFRGKPMAMLLSYGDTDPFSSGGVNALRSFQDACRYLGAEVAGMVYGSGSEPGDIAKDKGLMKEAYALGRQLARP
ncbi:MAG: flavodoxin family protein [Thermodesulfobacteriota bacterium]